MSEGNGSRPTTPGPNHDDELINNILPSYQMYQSTISKDLRVSDENFTDEPPTYERTPVNTSVSPPFVTLCSMQSPIDSPRDINSLLIDQFPFPSQTFNTTSAEFWENTILANVHRLPNLSKGPVPNEIALNLDIKIHVTEQVCQKGVKPTLIDPSNIEFTSHDYIHGYVTIENKSDVPITFDMVYVVFEGTLVQLENKRGLIDTEKPSNVFKFLNMTDLFASWSFANIDRLVTDNGDPHDWCEGETDPVDGTALSIDVMRTFQPRVTYKRYFTFRVPDKLLDDICDTHSLNHHTEVPPSMGVARHLISPSMLLATKDSQVKDLSFMDTSIAYSVDARVIGRASDYNYPTEHDQYVIAKEAICPIRVIPKHNPEIYYEDDLRSTSQYYKAFVQTIESKIAFGKDLQNTPVSKREEVALTPVSSRDSNSQYKLRQLYDIAGDAINTNLKKSPRKQFNDDSYQCMVPYKKKSLTGSSKVLGIVSLSTPKHMYKAMYVPPIRFRAKGLDPRANNELTIPLELSYFIDTTSSGKSNLPEIKYLKTELVALTIRSRKHSIPIEINHEMCFRDQEIDSKKREPDNFDTIVVKEFKEYLQQITNLISTLGNDLFKFESQLFKDIKSLAAIQTKYINLSIPENNINLLSRGATGSGRHSSIKTIPWELESGVNSSTGHSLYSKKFDVNFNLDDCQLKGAEQKVKGFDLLTLVPSFQTCLMARVYYVKNTIKLANGESLTVHSPVTIEN